MCGRIHGIIIKTRECAKMVIASSMKIMKTYRNAAKDCLFWYYRDKDNKEVDMILESDGLLHPIEIKRSVNPGTELRGAFKVLDNATIPRGTGAIICMRSDLAAIDSNTLIVPVWCI